MQGLEQIAWLEPWYPKKDTEKYFIQELYREVGPRHALYGQKAELAGRRDDRDDFIFRLLDLDFAYAVVHLTFSGKRDLFENYPLTILYTSTAELNLKIADDHDCFSLG